MVTRDATPLPFSDVSSLRAFVENIYACNYELARVDRPNLGPGDHAQLALWIKNKYPIPTSFGDPRCVALRAKFILHPKRVPDCGGEMTDGIRIVYSPGGSIRERGMLVGHSYLHGVAKRHSLRLTEADIWCLTGEWFCPLHLCRWWGAEEVIVRQPHCHRWLMRAYAARLAIWRGIRAAELPSRR